MKSSSVWNSLRDADLKDQPPFQERAARMDGRYRQDF